MIRRIRLICREDDWGNAANAGGPFETRYKTFDVDIPEEVGRWLAAFDDVDPSRVYTARLVTGVELLKP